MAYSDFTFAKLKKRFKITQESVYLFEGISIAPIAPSAKLLDDLKEAEQMPMLTEKAKSEYLIAPFVKDLKRRHPHLSIFSGYAFNTRCSSIFKMPSVFKTRPLRFVI